MTPPAELRSDGWHVDSTLIAPPSLQVIGSGGSHVTALFHYSYKRLPEQLGWKSTDPGFRTQNEISWTTLLSNWHQVMGRFDVILDGGIKYEGFRYCCLIRTRVGLDSDQHLGIQTTDGNTKFVLHNSANIFPEVRTRGAMSPAYYSMTAVTFV